MVLADAAVAVVLAVPEELAAGEAVVAGVAVPGSEVAVEAPATDSAAAAWRAAALIVTRTDSEGAVAPPAAGTEGAGVATGAAEPDCCCRCVGAIWDAAKGADIIAVSIIQHLLFELLTQQLLW